MDGYNSALADKAVHLRELLLGKRFFRIAVTIWIFASLLREQQNTIGSAQLVDKRKAVACRIRESLVALGVTFIKFGQFLSMRPDILPVELTDELSLLQDQVPPISFAQVRTITEKELAEKIDEVFDSFEQQPIASASIGQVHRAVLKDGRAVAVKVQRPDLIKAIYEDLGIMRLIARLAKSMRIKGDWQGWLHLSDQFGNSLFAEMDYLQEGRHADQLRAILRGLPAIIIPRVVWRYTTRKVLTEELYEGVKIDNLRAGRSGNIDLKRLAGQLITAYLEQIFVHGFFHADPHAGNFAITDSGQLIIYDFGMVSFITTSQRAALFNIQASIVNDDINAFIAALEQLEIIVQVSPESRGSLQKALLPFLAFCRGSASANLDLSALEKEIDILLKNQSFQLPSNLAYFIRTAVSLEGVVRMLDPDFNFIRSAKAYFRQKAALYLI